MEVWDPETTMKSFKLSVLAWVCLFLASCSLIESSKQVTEARSPVPAQTGDGELRERRQLCGIMPFKRRPNPTRLESFIIKMGTPREPSHHSAHVK